MTTTFDELLARMSAGEGLGERDLAELAQSADILPLGMLADALRRRLHGTTVTYLRVSSVEVDAPGDAPPGAAAGEFRLTGSPASLDAALQAVEAVLSFANGQPVAGFSWSDVERLAAADNASMSRVLERLRAAGLEALVDVPLDRVDGLDDAVDALAASGFRQIRLTIAAAPAAERLQLVRRAAAVQRRVGCVRALNPLPTLLDPIRPTTGYDDVKSVALARLAAPEIPVIQVDWLKYGPKLAQVALTFGADDLDGVSASDTAPEGRRRAPVEEVRRNVEAAGFEPAERDGRFEIRPR